jgi:hypothetical protein
MAQIDAELDAATDRIEVISNALETTGDTSAASSAKLI